MTVLKCKMCGGDLNFEEGATVVECEYCGTKQTVPVIDDEKKITLFARANRLRFTCEFDKASGIYESIVADFPTEAEAYWGLVLCKYGIEYVDDPATGKKIPTCHRSSFESVMEDDNFEQVMENADPIARAVYREEAKQIEELRRGIIEVSNKEEPYDIFICYKETAGNGERTIDSVIAQDVYNELTEKGYRVFFSRITLEDKLGQEYEPYIFAALNSAKIMLAFGTDYEYYNAVWVKNEWSRFLQLIAKGEKKTLIPCYKNIDAYDMPKEFAKLQAQDMGKVGAMQDLLRGIEKLLPREESAQEQPGKETVIEQQPAQSATVDSLLKRAFMYLEDSDWSNAADYCNRVLDIDPENADAYVGLLMAELQVREEEELAGQKKSFGQNKHFIKAVRFAGEERRKVLDEYDKAVEEYRTRRELLKKISVLMSAADDYVIGLKSDGNVVVASDNEHEQCKVSAWKHIVSVATGRYCTVGLKFNGTVVTTNDTFDVSNWKDIISVAVGHHHIVGLKSDRTVVVAGDNKAGNVIVSDWKDIVSVVAGSYHIVGLKSDGTVVAAGDNYKGQCNVLDWKDIITVTASHKYTVGIKSDGTVVATGDNCKGRCDVSDWKDIVFVAIGSYHIIGLKSDGTVVAAGYNNYGQCNVTDWTDIVAVAAGSKYTVGLKSDGTVIVTDGNDHQLRSKIRSWKLFNSFETWEQEIAKSRAHWQEEARKQAEEQARKQAEERARKQAEERARKQAEERARKQAEEQARKQEEEQARKQARKQAEEQARKQAETERMARRQSNLCQHCGGEFKGLFTKKCSVCGKPKDY